MKRFERPRSAATSSALGDRKCGRPDRRPTGGAVRDDRGHWARCRRGSFRNDLMPARGNGARCLSPVARRCTRRGRRLPGDVSGIGPFAPNASNPRAAIVRSMALRSCVSNGVEARKARPAVACESSESPLPEARAEQAVAALERRRHCRGAPPGGQPAAGEVSRGCGAMRLRRPDSRRGRNRPSMASGNGSQLSSRARDLLRGRLTRHGIAPAGLIAASLLEAGARAEVPAPLREATVATAIKGTPAAAGVTVLADLVSKSLFIGQITMIGAVISLIAMAAGFGLALRGKLAMHPAQILDPSLVAAGRP